MRSSLLVATLLFASLGLGCAKKDQINTCFPVSSWSAPVFKCVGEAPPPPVVVKEEPKPEPPPPPPAVDVQEEKIELNEKIQFEFAKAELLPQSKKLLDEVAKTLNEHPEIEKIRIEGHTDNEASNAYNMKLSNNRAASVRLYLQSKGVAAGRMESKGFGEDKPIADNGTPDGRETNRRVEIHITKRKK
jgi:outer membrane protein OmpA-like peptidoglycan-associated protein